MRKMNLPNKLTVLRMILIPFFVASVMYIPNETAMRLISAAVFGLTSITDMLDGKIARKYNLVTNFGKFLDPVADKLMIISAYLALLTTVTNNKTLYFIFTWATFIVVVREIAVTSLRMIAANSVVIAANNLGKIKTCSQIACVLTVLLEPLFFGWCFIGEYHILTYATIIFMGVMTLWSGINYLMQYKEFLNPEK